MHGINKMHTTTATESEIRAHSCSFVRPIFDDFQLFEMISGWKPVSRTPRETGGLGKRRAAPGIEKETWGKRSLCVAVVLSFDSNHRDRKWCCYTGNELMVKLSRKMPLEIKSPCQCSWERPQITVTLCRKMVLSLRWSRCWVRDPLQHTLSLSFLSIQFCHHFELKVSTVLLYALNTSLVTVTISTFVVVFCYFVFLQINRCKIFYWMSTMKIKVVENRDTFWFFLRSSSGSGQELAVSLDLHLELHHSWLNMSEQRNNTQLMHWYPGLSYVGAQ